MSLFMLFCGLSAFIIISIFISFGTFLVARPYVYDSFAEMPSRPIAVVFGTSPFSGGGKPNTYFQMRMNVAAGLYHAGKIKEIIVSGDNREVTYNEPKAMRKALEDRGVPSNVIHEDFAGRDTLDSVLRTRDIFEVNDPLYITQRFHADRAITIARWNGINAIAYTVPESGEFLIRIKLYLREYLARIKMSYELITGETPEIMGARTPIRIHEGDKNRYRNESTLAEV